MSIEVLFGEAHEANETITDPSHPAVIVRRSDGSEEVVFLQDNEDASAATSIAMAKGELLAFQKLMAHAHSGCQGCHG